MKSVIPVPAIERLSRLFTIARRLQEEGKKQVSSSELENLTGIQAHNIRKDMSMLGPAASGKAGYSTEGLQELIGKAFGLNTGRKVCVAGLDMLGTAILNNPGSGLSGFEIAAGFDSSTNRMEMMTTDVPLFHFHEIEERVRQLGIEFAILAVDAMNAEKTADRLIAGGVKGILNFSPVPVTGKKNVLIRNIYIVEELRLLCAMTAARTADNPGQGK